MMLPQDLTREEKYTIKFLMIQLYQKLSRPEDKFIVAMLFELGYSVDDTATALGYNSVEMLERVTDIGIILNYDIKARFVKI